MLVSAVMPIGMGFDRGRFGKKFLEAINQFFQLGVSGKQLFNLGTKLRTLSCGLLVSKYVVVVLHCYEIPRANHNIELTNNFLKPLRIHVNLSVSAQQPLYAPLSLSTID
jgi:hypothetical protein